MSPFNTEKNNTDHIHIHIPKYFFQYILILEERKVFEEPTRISDTWGIAFAFIEETILSTYYIPSNKDA